MTRFLRKASALCWLAAILLFSLSAYSASDSSATRLGRFLGAKPTVYPDWFKESFLDFIDDVNEAAAVGKRLLVIFHQDGCPYCNVLVESNLSQKHIEEKVRNHFDVVAINMWGDREVVTVDGKPYTEKSFAAALRVQFTPTLVFFDEAGKVVIRSEAYFKIFHTQSLFTYYFRARRTYP